MKVETDDFRRSLETAKVATEAAGWAFDAAGYSLVGASVCVTRPAVFIPSALAGFRLRAFSRR